MADNFSCNGSRIVNLRDLGGYRGRGGLRVKRGLLFRSGDLDLPTGVLDEELAPLGVSLVFDLRSKEEARARPYALPGGIRYRHRPVFSSLAECTGGRHLGFWEREKLFRVLSGLSLSHEELRPLGRLMLGVYEAMGEDPAVFGGIMKEIVEHAGEPLLFHCMAGKDRTGVLATMILLALGVSQEDAKEHYLLSNDCRREVVEREMKLVAAIVKDPAVVGVIGEMMTAREEYIELVLDRVSSYPAFEDYARARMGLASADLEALGRIYLE